MSVTVVSSGVHTFCSSVYQHSKSSMRKSNSFRLEIHHYSVKLKAENRLEHWTTVSFCLELFSSGRVRFPPGSIDAHCWRVPNKTKQLSSAPASFRLSTLLINDEFLIEKFWQNFLLLTKVFLNEKQIEKVGLVDGFCNIDWSWYSINHTFFIIIF